MPDLVSPLCPHRARALSSHPVGRVALALAVMAAPTAARADADADAPADAPAVPRAELTHHDEVSLGATARALRSPSANALTGANLAGASLGIARDLGHDLGVDRGSWLRPGLTLWVEAGLVTGSADGTMFQSLSTSIDALGLTGGLAARYRLHRRLAAGARVALGAQRVRAAITDSTGTTAYDHGWGAMASAAASLDLFLINPSRFRLGLRLEAGYVAAQGIALTLHTDRPGDALPLAMTELSLGHLDLSGPTAGVSLLGQF
jgi:hypothetical protein